MKPLSDMTALIIGLGQIGGSIAYELHQRSIVKRVIGVDTVRRVLRQARAAGVIDAGSVDWRTAFDNADIVVLAAPIRQILHMLPDIAKRLQADQICLDVAGIKGGILDVINGCGRRVNFIGGHPLAGTERRGFAGAQPGLFANTTFVLVPSRGSSQAARSRAKQLVKRLGARVLDVDAPTHDRIIAHTSHLPYALAITLAQSLGKASKEHSRMIGGSFRSATRVANSSPELTLDMLLSNRVEIGKAIRQFVHDLDKLQRLVENGNERGLRQIISRAATAAGAIHQRNGNASRGR